MTTPAPTFGDDVVRSTINRVTSAFGHITRTTGVDPEGFVIVINPHRWLAMRRDLQHGTLVESNYKTGERKLWGHPVVLQDDLEPGRIILRAEIDA